MDINWFGFSLLLIITIWVAYKKSFRFIDAFILFLPFNSTAIFFIGDTPVNLPFTLFFFAFISYCVQRFFTAKILIPKSKKTSFVWLFFIAFVAILSEIMPFIINGSYKVLDRYGSLVFYAEEIPLYPSMQWITQLLYFLIGILITYIVSITYTNKNEIKRVLKLLLIGISFMVFWGWFEYLCFFTGIPYPYLLLNHIGMSREGILVLENLPRMSSITLEPSYFAQQLIPTIPYFYWFSKQKEQFVFSKKYNKFMYVASSITSLIAYTTTGVLGFFMVLGIWLKNKLNIFTKRTKYFLVTIYLLLFCLALAFVIKYLINLSGTFSGVERFKTVYLGIKYFLDFPLLGLGWGVFPTFDLLVNLLVNFGIIGAVSFAIFIYNIYRKLHINFKKNTSKKLYKAAIESLFLLLLVSQLSGFIYHSQYFWAYVGVTISIASLKYDID